MKLPSNHIYLDHNATSPVDSRVLEAMVEELQHVGNPSSVHSFGRQARQRLDRYREQIAHFFGVKPQELIFTSGGTEGANLLLRGLSRTKPHIVTSNLEHACVYETVKRLEKEGSPVTFLNGNAYGAVQPDQLREALRPDTGLITLMYVNNETGVKTDIPSIAKIAGAHRVPLVVDGVAILGKEVFSIPEGVTGIFFSGHKIGAPKGIGLCILRKGVQLNPLIIGGGQEGGRRSGTENLPGIAALAKAIELLALEGEERAKRMLRLRESFEQTLMQQLPMMQINGTGPRTTNVVNTSFAGIDGEELIIRLDQQGLAVSHGSACASGAREPSRILTMMGLPTEQVRGAIRFSIGLTTTQEEIDRAAAMVIKNVA